MRELIVVAVTLLAVACGAADGRSTVAGARGPTAHGPGESFASTDGEGAQGTTCSREPKEAKELEPCFAECDRGLVSSCATAAASMERSGGKLGSLTRAVGLHERACQLDDAASCASAARMYATGTGVPPSRPRQMELLARACALGDPYACTIPAKAYANGVGVPKDEARARELYERGCAGGAPVACAALGEP